MTAVIKHAEEVEPRISAFSEKLYEQAIQQAQKAEKTYHDSRSTPRPLEGLPIALKDERFMAGMLASEGSLLAKDFIAEETHPIVERIMAAGAIVYARTTTPEYSCAGFTHSKLWGVTRNPWNLEYRTAGLLRRANDDPVQHYRPLSGPQCHLWRSEQWRSHGRTNCQSQL